MTTETSTTETADQASTRNPAGKAAARGRRGRPKGTRHTPPDVVIVEPSRCKQCGSTRRSDYYDRHEHAYRGELNGKPYTHVVWRRTKCLDCGQTRIDRTYENRPEDETLI